MKPPTISSFNAVSFHHLNLGALCKSIAISGLALFLFYTVWSNHANGDYTSSTASDRLIANLQIKWPLSSNDISNVVPPTDISHIGFIVVSSLETWKHRKPYTESWWRPNVTRGYVFFDKEPTTPEFLPWPVTSPPWRVNEDITKLRVYPRLVNPVEVRIFRSILDMYRVVVGDDDGGGLRWFIMGDDDTLFFVDNLVEVLGKYDHKKYHYIGMNSECVKSNADFSFDMAFGGAGYALSYALVEVLAPKLDACIERYPYLYVSDHLAQSCLADIGISLTIEKGIHQIDLHGDISGLLSSHPQSPALSLHHFDAVEPIFPSMDRYQAALHIMKPGKLASDQSRMFQQTICYQRKQNFTFSISWGYSVHIYETIIPRSILRKPLETFKPWNNNHVKHYPSFMFNTRKLTNNSCESPHVFFFRSIDKHVDDNDRALVFATNYGRASSRGLPPCHNNHSGDSISTVKVLSSATVHKLPGVIECCDVEYEEGAIVAEIKIRSCTRDEVLA